MHSVQLNHDELVPLLELCTVCCLKDDITISKDGILWTTPERKVLMFWIMLLGFGY